MPLNFPKRAPSATPTADSLDLATGIGYKRFFAVRTDNGFKLFQTRYDSSSRIYGSTDLTDNGKFTKADITGINNVLVKTIDRDLDLKFTRSSIVKGTLFLQFTYGIVSNAAGNVTFSHVVYIYHVTSGGTETQLATFNSGSSAENGGAVERRILLDFDISNRLFKQGETLRVTIEIWAASSTGASPDKDAILYHDGNNRETSLAGDNEFTNHDTDIIVDVPFKQP